jgi:hypothetical protein
MTFSQIEGRLTQARAEMELAASAADTAAAEQKAAEARLFQVLASIELREPGAQAKLRGAELALGKARAAAKKADEQLETWSAAVELISTHLLRQRSKDLQDLRLGCAQRLLENQTQFAALMVSILQVVNNAKVASAGILKAEAELERLHPERLLNRLQPVPITSLDFAADHHLSHERADAIRERIRSVAAEPFVPSVDPLAAQASRAELSHTSSSQPMLPLGL